MPFTFAHPAIVLPFGYLPQRWVSMTGLIIGSLAPDFEYFLRMKVQSNYSHTFAGIFWFDLPLAVLLAFVFHGIVRNPLIENAPKFLYQRFSPFQNFSWPQYFKTNILIVILSCLIGALTHILWDSFTHESGFVISNIPFLKSSLLIIGKEIPVYKLLQHSSTSLGFLIISYTLWNLPKAIVLQRSKEKPFWIIVLLIALLVMLLKFFTGLHISAYGNIIVTCISAVFIGLLASSVFCKLSFRKAG